jgi:hypothetical protein
MSPETQTQTPAQIAQNEAVRQAVILGFGLVAMMIMMRVQKRAARDVGEAQRLGFDPDMRRSEKMQAALQARKLYGRIADALFAAAGWAWNRSERARLEYEREAA